MRVQQGWGGGGWITYKHDGGGSLLYFQFKCTPRRSTREAAVQCDTKRGLQNNTKQDQRRRSDTMMAFQYIYFFHLC